MLLLSLLELFSFIFSCLSIYTSDLSRNFIIYHYQIICFLSYIYFMVFHWYIMPLLIFYYWSSTTYNFHFILWICFFYVLGIVTPAFLIVLIRCFCLIFFLCSLEAITSFSSSTLPLLSPFLCYSIPNLTSLFFLLQSQRPWYYHHHQTLLLLLVLQFYLAGVLFLIYLILSLVLNTYIYCSFVF